jgi:hypothetical protein
VWTAYIDDAGDPEVLPNAVTNGVTPLFVIAAVAFDQACLHSVTMQYLALKRRFFPKLIKATPHLLEWVRPEIKGTDLKRMMRSEKRKERRTATTFINEVMNLLEANGAQVFARVWIKKIAEPVDKQAMTTFSIQACAANFQRLLEERDGQGLVVVDSSSPRLNAAVSHSIFTQKFKAAGDAYDRIIEMPVFGHSENHVGIQIADIVASGLIFPIASHVYCDGYVTSVHVHARFSEVKVRYASRLKRLQHRYYDDSGFRRGGIVTSDKIANRSGNAMFV